MQIEYFIFLVSSYFFVLFFFQKKFSFCIDLVSQTEKHKLLLKSRGAIPLIGSFYFFPIISILFYEYYLFQSIFVLFFFILGLMSDLKLAVSPKLRLILQFIIIFIFIFMNKNLIIQTNISTIDNLMKIEFFRIVIVSFFFLVLINGYNFIDGVNLLCSLNFAIVLFFLSLIVVKSNDLTYFYKIQFLLTSLIIFIIFNFFGKIFLGDGGVYGFSFFIGFLLVQLSLSNEVISPYFIANLFWYPAFENLFTIIRRIALKKKKYLPDNLHFHQLLFKFFIKKNFFKKKYLTSSFVGILINMYLLTINTIGFRFIAETEIQIFLIFLNILLYILIYLRLNNA